MVAEEVEEEAATTTNTQVEVDVVVITTTNHQAEVGITTNRNQTVVMTCSNLNLKRQPIESHNKTQVRIPMIYKIRGHHSLSKSDKTLIIRQRKDSKIKISR